MRLQTKLECMIKSRDNRIKEMNLRILAMQTKIDKFDETKAVLLSELNAALFMIYGEGHDTAESILKDAFSKGKETWR